MSSFFYINIYKKNTISYAISLIHIILFLIIWWGTYYFYNTDTNEQIVYATPISILAIVWTLMLIINSIYVLFAFGKSTSSSTINKKIIGDIRLSNSPTPVDGDWIKDKIIGKYIFDGAVHYWYDWLRFYKVSISASSYEISGLYRQQEFPRNIINTYSNQAELDINQQKQIKEDLFAFKTFEMGDDPRRIVWKIYGKNRTLHVRKADDSYTSTQTINIIIYPPQNDYKIDDELYIILQSEYKRHVLDILHHWAMDAQLNISLQGITYSNINAFQQIWLEDVKPHPAITTIPANAIILTNNFSKQTIAQAEHTFIFNYTFSNISPLKNRIIFRSSKESIQLSKRINQTNKILSNNTITTSPKRNQQLAAVIQISDT